jgi:hypothetical protein
LQVGCSGAIVETSSNGIWRIPMLSCGWSFGLCRGCCDTAYFVVPIILAAYYAFFT